MKEIAKRDVKFKAWHKIECKMCEVEILRPGHGAFLVGLIPEEDQVIAGGRFTVKKTMAADGSVI